MVKQFLSITLFSVICTGAHAGASQLLNCSIGDAVGAINFSTQTRPDLDSPAKTLLKLQIEPTDEHLADRNYTATISTANKNAILKGKKVVVLMRSSESFDFGGDTSQSSLVVFNADENGKTLISDRGGVLQPKCEPTR